MSPTKELAVTYKPTIGIECHVQLKTQTKLFAGVSNDARSAEPNTLISHICLGMPGALPVLNRAALDLAMRAAFALNTEPQMFSKFDRKHYFYPDLPKGYQISQYDQPIISGGFVEINIGDRRKNIGITRAHLEEDAGKNTHPDGADYSLVDLNRAGTPLLEIVSEPDINSAEEAKAFAHELYLLMKYSNVSDVDMYHGNMRFDINVSVSSDPNKLGTRTEVKNLNSFRSIESAVNFEIDRQIEVLKSGKPVIQETRGWDESKQKTISQRGKEEAHDYRYMPEPDVPPIVLTREEIDKAKDSLPLLPPAIRQELASLLIEPPVVEDILDQPNTLKHVRNVLKKGSAVDAKRVAFWFVQSEENSDSHSIKTDNLIKLSNLISEQTISSSTAKIVFNEMHSDDSDPIEIAKRLDLIQVSDENEMDRIVAEVISENQKAADDVKAGEMKAIGFLVGHVMKKSEGRANPGLAQQLIKKHLGL